MKGFVNTLEKFAKKLFKKKLHKMKALICNYMYGYIKIFKGLL